MMTSTFARCHQCGQLYGVNWLRGQRCDARSLSKARKRRFSQMIIERFARSRLRPIQDYSDTRPILSLTKTVSIESHSESFVAVFYRRYPLPPEYEVIGLLKQFVWSASRTLRQHGVSFPRLESSRVECLHIRLGQRVRTKHNNVVSVFYQKLPSIVHRLSQPAAKRMNLHLKSV